MERLQAAIEKARAQREAAPAPAPVRTRRAGGLPEAVKAPASEDWMALTELQVSKRQLHRNRITAFDGGRESAPYDMLRTRMLQQAKQNGWRRIALVSSHSNCGKSTAAANLAFSLSRQLDMRSMVLDLDMRRSGLSKILGQNCAHNMADVLSGGVPFAGHGYRFGVNVAFGLNSDRVVRNPAEILQSPQARELLDEIDTTYAPDVMLFDMPPMMASDDNFGFLQNVDCALLLVAAEKTSMTQIDIAERHISELTNVMGIVLNKCRYTSGAHGYEYNYY